MSVMVPLTWAWPALASPSSVPPSTAGCFDCSDAHWACPGWSQAQRVTPGTCWLSHPHMGPQWHHTPSHPPSQTRLLGRCGIVISPLHTGIFETRYKCQRTIVEVVCESHHMQGNSAAIATVEHPLLCQSGVKGNLPDAVKVESIKEDQAGLIGQRSRFQDLRDGTLHKERVIDDLEDEIWENGPCINDSFWWDGISWDSPTCSVVWDPCIYYAHCLLRLSEVQLVKVGLKDLVQSPSVLLLQGHLPLHHHTTGCLHGLLPGQVSLLKTLLLSHDSLCKTAVMRVLSVNMLHKFSFNKRNLQSCYYVLYSFYKLMFILFLVCYQRETSTTFLTQCWKFPIGLLYFTYCTSQIFVIITNYCNKQVDL